MKALKIVVIVLVVLALLYFILWKFVIKTSAIQVKDGTIYKMGGNYYFGTDSGRVKINLDEYNALKNEVEGQCTNPNPTTFDITPCDYFGYNGQLNDCGRCIAIKPLTKTPKNNGVSCEDNYSETITAIDDGDISSQTKSDAELKADALSELKKCITARGGR